MPYLKRIETRPVKLLKEPKPTTPGKSPTGGPARRNGIAAKQTDYTLLSPTAKPTLPSQSGLVWSGKAMFEISGLRMT
jgi:hypothetical protein